MFEMDAIIESFDKDVIEDCDIVTSISKLRRINMIWKVSIYSWLGLK